MQLADGRAPSKIGPHLRLEKDPTGDERQSRTRSDENIQKSRTNKIR